MTKMTRRGFLRHTSALVAVAASPIPKAMALVAPDGPALRWFAVGDDEMAYPFLAPNMETAIRYYAHEMGRTKGDACPVCDEISCLEHLAPSEWDEPQDWIEEYSAEPAAWKGLGPDSEPTNVDWLRAGYRTPCEGSCDDLWGECDDCYEFEGKALCCDCLEIAKVAKLDDIIGNGYPTVFQEERL